MKKPTGGISNGTRDGKAREEEVVLPESGSHGELARGELEAVGAPQGSTSHGGGAPPLDALIAQSSKKEEKNTMAFSFLPCM